MPVKFRQGLVVAVPQDIISFQFLKQGKKLSGGGVIWLVFSLFILMKTQFDKTFEEIISTENLLLAWREFANGKKKKADVQEFSFRLMDNILFLHSELSNQKYKHGAYQSFNISDPKPRNIHKALVRDRFLHHAVYRQLYPLFDRTFIADSYSCRIGKGTHRAINRFRLFGSRVSRNNTRTAWILKCDIRKFFANIDHQVLINILREHIADEKILWLLSEIIGSFQSKREGVGLPLGNLTSQLLVNIYMNRFDQFAKHKLKAKYYIRYADDFVIFSEKKEDLENLIQQVGEYLQDELKLELHPKKVSIGSLASGVDFLGWVHFSDHRVLRTTTKRRMIKMIQEKPKPETINSYLGMLKHGNACKLREEIF